MKLTILNKTNVNKIVIDKQPWVIVENDDEINDSRKNITGHP